MVHISSWKFKCWIRWDEILNSMAGMSNFCEFAPWLLYLENHFIPFLSAECSFLRPNNSYQGWPSMKIFLTKTLNIWANRTICLQILFWIRDRGSFFFPSTNSRIHLAPQQHRCSIKIKIKTFKNFFNKIDNVLFKIRQYSNKSFWLSANRVAKLPCRRVCRQRVRFLVSKGEGGVSWSGRPSRWSLYWYFDFCFGHLCFQIQVTEKYSIVPC